MGTLGERLLLLRQNKGMKAVEVIAKTNIDNLGRYEKDQRKPNIDALLSLANFYNVSTDYLLKGEEQQINNVSNRDGNAKYNLSKSESELLEYFEKLSDIEKGKLLGILSIKIGANNEISSTLEFKSKLSQSKNLKNTDGSKNEASTKIKIV